MNKGAVLLGYMGSGKSSVAKELALHLEVQHIDLDSYIERSEGLTVNEIFREKGEIYFRKKERFYLEEIFKNKQPLILSLGGGTPCYGDTMNLINQTPDLTSIYLSANVNTLTERLFKEKENRPLISHLDTREDLNDFIRKHLFERSYFYNQAKMIVKTDGKSITEIMDEIKQKLF